MSVDAIIEDVKRKVVDIYFAQKLKLQRGALSEKYL